MRKIIFGLVITLTSVAQADSTSCDGTVVKSVFSKEFAQATYAYCQENSRAAFMLNYLLDAFSSGEVNLVSSTNGAVRTAAGFTTLALVGYKLKGAMFHLSGGKSYISVLLAGTDAENAIVAYSASYQVPQLPRGIAKRD